MKNLIIVLLFFLCPSSFTHASTIIDLTHSFNDKTIYWPTAKGFELQKIAWGMTQNGYFYAGNTFCTPEHGGTHLDAPIHFAKDHWTVDKIPVERFVGRAVVIDLREKVQNNAEYLILEKDILEWEATHRKLSSNDIVLFNTGWSRFWEDKKKYLGSDKFRDVDNLHFPGISEEAAKFIVNRKVKGVGLDTASLDYGQSRDFMAHRILLGANIYGIENVANINPLPADEATLYVAPMKIEEGTGAPVRIYGMVE